MRIFTKGKGSLPNIVVYEALKSTYLHVYRLFSPKVETIYMPDLEQPIGLLRADLVHPDFGGNKYYKLHYNLQQAKLSGLPLLTFSGAHSNHLVAVAAAAKKLGIPAIGVIRGDELHAQSGLELQYAAEQGMNLHFVSRSDYRRRYDPDFDDELKQRFGLFYLLPEGGTNAAAVRGCTHLLSEQTDEYDHIFSAIGTGGTVAGLAAGAKPHQQVTGILVVNDAKTIRERIRQLLLPYPNATSVNINTDYLFGGYAKTNSELLNFMHSFHKHTSIPLDKIYTGKLLFAVHQLLLSGNLKYGRVLVLHSGGYSFSGGQY
jgi:1-aminocyclopropane-1-carboxylate deaminase/D-cysteine desulfhydrase-like pyridoxal-dependent ACC family enzyme